MYTFNKEEVLKDWEMKLVYETAFEEGQIEAQKEVAKKMLESRLAIEIIAQTTGLSLSEIESLNNPLLNDEEK